MILRQTILTAMFLYSNFDLCERNVLLTYLFYSATYSLFTKYSVESMDFPGALGNPQLLLKPPNEPAAFARLKEKIEEKVNSKSHQLFSERNPCKTHLELYS